MHVKIISLSNTSLLIMDLAFCMYSSFFRLVVSAGLNTTVTLREEESVFTFCTQV